MWINYSIIPDNSFHLHSLRCNKIHCNIPNLNERVFSVHTLALPTMYVEAISHVDRKIGGCGYASYSSHPWPPDVAAISARCVHSASEQMALSKIVSKLFHAQVIKHTSISAH